MLINILQGKCICTVLVTGFLLVPEGTRSKSQSLRGFIGHFCCLVAYLTGNILTWYSCWRFAKVHHMYFALKLNGQ
jgi:hypothetical protein